MTTSTPYESLSEWLKEEPGFAACKVFRGPWRTLKGQENDRLLSLDEEPGTVDVHQQFYHYRVVVVGPTDWESRTAELKSLRDLMQTIITRVTGEDYQACGVAQVDVIGGIMGPGYTETGRPWYGVTLQLLV
jgi:hypothetical protein